jgi:hypothetical protein
VALWEGMDWIDLAAFRDQWRYGRAWIGLI